MILKCCISFHRSASAENAYDLQNKEQDFDTSKAEQFAILEQIQKVCFISEVNEFKFIHLD